MIIPYQADGRSIADLAHDLDARTRLANPEAFAGQDLAVALGVEFGETLGEFKLVAIDIECPVGTFFSLDGVLRQAIGIDTQEIAHARLLEGEITRYPVEAHHMDDILLHRAEDPLEHVIEVNTDVGGDAAALVDIALPRGVIPLAPGGNVREIDVIHLVCRALVHLLFEGDDGFMETELEDVIGLVAGFLFDLLQRVDVVGVQHHRFLADDITTQAETIADESIMRVVRGADAHPVERVVALFLLGAITIEELVLREEGTIREETVQPADAVELVIRRQEVVSSILDCL